jgi:pSer/pThr/pTyr-binding forkhead associated (FHA) protein
MEMATVTNGKHLLIIEDNQGRKEFLLENLVYSIGRDHDCHIRLFS